MSRRETEKRRGPRSRIHHGEIRGRFCALQADRLSQGDENVACSIEAAIAAWQNAIKAGTPLVANRRKKESYRPISSDFRIVSKVAMSLALSNSLTVPGSKLPMLSEWMSS